MKTDAFISNAIDQISIALFCVLLLQGYPAAGETFGERFQNWVFGSDPAQTRFVSAEGIEVERRCLGCHDGLIATRITTKDADSPMRFSSRGKQVVHPTGMNYDEYAGARATSFRSRQTLDSGIVLIDGSVTCVSCHRLAAGVTTAELAGTDAFNDYAPGDAALGGCLASAELTVGPRISDLCLACHVK